MSLYIHRYKVTNFNIPRLDLTFTMIPAWPRDWPPILVFGSPLSLPPGLPPPRLDALLLLTTFYLLLLADCWWANCQLQVSPVITPQAVQRAPPGITQQTVHSTIKRLCSFSQISFSVYQGFISRNFLNIISVDFYILHRQVWLFLKIYLNKYSTKRIVFEVFTWNFQFMRCNFLRWMQSTHINY